MRHKNQQAARLFWLTSMVALGLLVAPFSFAPAVGAQGNEETPEPSDADPFVIICPVEGDILDGLAVLVERAVTQEAVGAEAIVFIVDTFGGRVDSAIDIAQTIMDAEIPTIAFITGRGAISAGALISYACDYIVMAPGANIGASTPVVPGVDMSEQMNEKSMSFLRAKYRALGEENGHNPLIGEAMVDPAIELYGRKNADFSYTVYKVEQNRVVETYATKADIGRFSVELPTGIRMEWAQPGVEDALRSIEETLRDIVEAPPDTDDTRRDQNESSRSGNRNAVRGLPDDARLISPSGSLLTLTTREAKEIGLIAYATDSPEKALHLLGFTSFRTVRIEMTWAEIIFTFLTSPLISSLLLLCGVGGIYVEFRTPGLGWPGLIGAICMALFFGSRLVIGIADWLDLLLVALGISLLLVEILFLPDFGIAGVAGIICLLAGIYMALTRVPIPEYTWDFVRLREAGTTLTLSGVFFLVFAVLTWRLFPRSRLARGLILADAQIAESGYVVQTDADETAALGRRGVTTTMLRPAGRGRFDNETFDLMTRGEFIEKGRPVEIIQAEGNRYVVRELNEEDNQQ